MKEVRETMETKKEKLRAELLRAKEKASEWTARARDIERQITECENTEILQVVRSVAATPEELREVLSMIRAANGKETPSNNLGKENCAYDRKKNLASHGGFAAVRFFVSWDGAVHDGRGLCHRPGTARLQRCH